MICSIALSPFYPLLLNTLAELIDCEKPKTHTQIWIKSLLEDHSENYVLEFAVREYGGIRGAIEVMNGCNDK